MALGTSEERVMGRIETPKVRELMQYIAAEQAHDSPDSEYRVQAFADHWVMDVRAELDDPFAPPLAPLSASVHVKAGRPSIVMATAYAEELYASLVSAQAPKQTARAKWAREQQKDWEFARDRTARHYKHGKETPAFVVYFWERRDRMTRNPIYTLSVDNEVRAIFPALTDAKSVSVWQDRDTLIDYRVVRK